MGDGEENLSRCKKDYNVDDILERDVKSGSPYFPCENKKE